MVLFIKLALCNEIHITDLNILELFSQKTLIYYLRNVMINFFLFKRIYHLKFLMITSHFKKIIIFLVKLII